jgi:hypothetical protein
MSQSKEASAIVRWVRGAACLAVAGVPTLAAAQVPEPIDRVQDIRLALLAAEPVAQVPGVDADQWDNFSNWNKV